MQRKQNTLRRIIRAMAMSVALLASVTGTAADPLNNSYYNDHADGWFWYELPPPEPEEPLPPPPPEPIAQQPAEETKPPQVPAQFSAAWLRDNMPRYLDIATDNPTRENVENYLYLQRLATDKSSAFVETYKEVIVGNPWLDENVRRSMTTAGAKKIDRVAREQRETILDEINHSNGIFFFFRSDCPYCHAMAPILAKLQDIHGFDILPISIDGKGLPGDHFPSFRINNGHAEQMGVTSVPSLFLVNRSGDMQPIGTGVMSITDVKTRVIIAAKKGGWITKEDYEKTLPFQNLDYDLAERLTSPAFEAAVAAGDIDADETGFVSPAQLTNFIRERIQAQ